MICTHSKATSGGQHCSFDEFVCYAATQASTHTDSKATLEGQHSIFSNLIVVLQYKQAHVWMYNVDRWQSCTTIAADKDWLTKYTNPLGS